MQNWSSSSLAGSDSDLLRELTELFETNTPALLERARAMAAGKKQILSAPCILDGSCQADPPCRHCKWQSLGEGRPESFAKKSIEAAVAHAVKIEGEGIGRLFLASGWKGYDLPADYYNFVRAIRAAVGMEIFGLFGAVNRSSLAQLKAAGMDGYLCGLESPDEDAYRTFRPAGDTLLSRIQTVRDCRDVGLKIWTGFLYGFGETEAGVKRALLFFKELDIDSLSILPFEPFPNTEMEAHDPPNLYRWSRIVAIAKIFLRDVNVFTSFGAHNMAAYGRSAGANGFYVVVPPDSANGQAIPLRADLARAKERASAAGAPAVSR
jgi:biotin synthase